MKFFNSIHILLFITITLLSGCDAIFFVVPRQNASNKDSLIVQDKNVIFKFVHGIAYTAPFI